MVGGCLETCSPPTNCPTLPPAPIAAPFPPSPQPELLAWKAKLFHKQAISGAPAVSGAPLTLHQELHALLFGGAPATPTQVPVSCQSAAAIAAGNSNFTTLVAAAQAAGLAPALSNAGLQATVFAPTNAAFAALLQALGVTPAQLLANTNLLASVLK